MRIVHLSKIKQLLNFIGKYKKKEVPLKEALLLTCIFILQINYSDKKYLRYLENILYINEIKKNFDSIIGVVNFLSGNFLDFSLNYHQSLINQNAKFINLSKHNINNQEIHRKRKISEIAANKYIQSKFPSIFIDADSKTDYSRNRNNNISHSKTDKFKEYKATQKKQLNLNNQKWDANENYINKFGEKNLICQQDSCIHDKKIHEKIQIDSNNFQNNNLNYNMIDWQNRATQQLNKVEFIRRFQLSITNLIAS